MPEIPVLGDVSDVMLKELAIPETWYQKAWRPFCGFVVGLGALTGIFMMCFLVYLAIVDKADKALDQMTTLAGCIAFILAIPGAAVGITAWHDGRAKVEEAKNGSDNK